MSQIYRIASPQITSEIVDGEVMIINLKNGHYFNLNGSCIEIWGLVQDGASRDKILSRLSQSYSADREALAAELDRLLAELQKEELIALFPGEDPPAQAASAPAAPLPFVAPVLTKYSDMQELLLLDPIHDVDDAGWPQAKAN